MLRELQFWWPLWWWPLTQLFIKHHLHQVVVCDILDEALACDTLKGALGDGSYKYKKCDISKMEDIEGEMLCFHMDWCVTGRYTGHRFHSDLCLIPQNASNLPKMHLDAKRISCLILLPSWMSINGKSALTSILWVKSLFKFSSLATFHWHKIFVRLTEAVEDVPSILSIVMHWLVFLFGQDRSGYAVTLCSQTHEQEK